jgi:serine/threonine-protein kinase
MAISQYRILSEIGQGQFGQVYCGSDRTTGELVALKKLDLRRSPTQRFLNELAILSKLEHPNIVQVKGLAYEKKERFLVTNYCQGGTLRHLMTPKIRPTLVQKLQIIQDVLLGLEHIHHHKIIHCDLKPENILLNVSSQGWNAQIADFGVAHGQDIGPAKQRLGDTGSPAYMAPERFYSHYSPASDIYAVGVMLYELLLGRRPFTGMPGEIMKAHFHQRVKVPKTLPFQLKIILKTALHKLPQHRYESAEQMRFALEAAIADIKHRQSQGDTIAEPILHSEFAASQRTSVQGETLGDRIAARPAISLNLSQLSPAQTLDGIVQELWTTAEYCFGLLQHQGQSQLARWSLTENSSPLFWTLPGLTTNCLSINSDGTWLSSTQSETESNQNSPQAVLQTISLKSFTPHHPVPIPQQPERLWMLDARHLLVAIPTDSPSQQSLQLWNRRGQVYWSYEVPFQMRHLTKSLVMEDRLVAIVENNTPAAVWIDLKPFRVQRFSLPQSADWICPARWGYTIANSVGEIACLNRRGKTIAKLSLNLPEAINIQSATLANPNILCIAIPNEQGSQIFTLNLSPYLPQRVVSLAE